MQCTLKALIFLGENSSTLKGGFLYKPKFLLTNHICIAWWTDSSYSEVSAVLCSNRILPASLIATGRTLEHLKGRRLARDKRFTPRPNPFTTASHYLAILVGFTEESILRLKRARKDATGLNAIIIWHICQLGIDPELSA